MSDPKNPSSPGEPGASPFLIDPASAEAPNAVRQDLYVVEVKAYLPVWSSDGTVPAVRAVLDGLTGLAKGTQVDRVKVHGPTRSRVLAPSPERLAPADPETPTTH